MAQWAVVIPGERYESERLFHHETLELSGLEVGLPRPAPGDEVLVLARDETPVVVALGRVEGFVCGSDPDDPASAGQDAGPLVIAYTRRAFDDPQPVEQLALPGPVSRLDPATYRALAGRVKPAPSRTPWQVSLALPIEASSAAEAVRLFWSYVVELGPRELPTFVSPSGNELAMQAFVLGDEANQDPEEDD